MGVDAIGESRVSNLPVARQGETSSRSPHPDGPDFGTVLRGLARRVDDGERAVSNALDCGPRAGDAQGILALQAGVYRYVESVDLCSKLVDRASSAVKTTLQNQ